MKSWFKIGSVLGVLIALLLFTAVPVTAQPATSQGSELAELIKPAPQVPVIEISEVHNVNDYANIHATRDIHRPGIPGGGNTVSLFLQNSSDSSVCTVFHAPCCGDRCEWFGLYDIGAILRYTAGSSPGTR